jgi:hypothetical protein
VADVYLDYDYIAAELAAGRQPQLPPGAAARGRAAASNATTGGQRSLLASGSSRYSSNGVKRTPPLSPKKAMALSMQEFVDQYPRAPRVWRKGYELYVDYNVPRETGRVSQRQAAPAASMLVNPVEDAGTGAPSPTVQAPAPAVAAAAAINMTRCNALLDFFGATASELGNGVCSNGPYNTEACGWDLGDCE